MTGRQRRIHAIKASALAATGTCRRGRLVQVSGPAALENSFLARDSAKGITYEHDVDLIGEITYPVTMMCTGRIYGDAKLQTLVMLLCGEFYL